MALNLVRQLWDYVVLVTKNMIGDMLSELGAGLMGGIGMAPLAAVMLEWLGERHGNAAAIHAGQRLHTAVEQAFGRGNLLPFELSGTDGSIQISAAIHRALTPTSATNTA